MSLSRQAIYSFTAGASCRLVWATWLATSYRRRSQVLRWLQWARPCWNWVLGRLKIQRLRVCDWGWFDFWVCLSRTDLCLYWDDLLGLGFFLFFCDTCWDFTDKWSKLRHWVAKIQCVRSSLVKPCDRGRCPQIFFSVNKLKTTFIIACCSGARLTDWIHDYLNHIFDHLRHQDDHVFVWCAQERICIAFNKPDP